MGTPSKRPVTGVPVTGQIYTTQELAVRWKTTEETVEKMFRTGRLRGAFKAGRQWRLSEKALVEHELGDLSGVA